MITKRAKDDRGYADHGWLRSKHTFSFASYYDPAHMGVSALRVINDDWIAPGTGFDTHPHKDMEIISYIINGTIAHKDTMGFETQIRGGEVQVMSAGTGVAHSEYNASDSAELTFLQIWITPSVTSIEPSYQQTDFSEARGVTLIVSPDGAEGSLKIHQDARIFQLRLAADDFSYETRQDRIYYLHQVKGSLTANGVTLEAGDALTIRDEAEIHIQSGADTEALLFELPL